MSIKMVFVPPHVKNLTKWLACLSDAVPYVKFVAPADKATAKEELKDADAAFGTVSPGMLAYASNLRWIQAPAAAPPPGYYYKELIEHPCTVTNFRGIYNDHIGAHIMAMLLAFSKNLHIYRDFQNRKVWYPLPEEKHRIFLPECIALIVGVGGIGEETARLCRAFELKVLGIDARRIDKPDFIDDIGPPERLVQMLPRADFVIATLPHTPASEGLFDKAKFAVMKRGAFFINVGRGRTTRLDDLAEALTSGTLGGAGLDVFEEEPLSKESPLWSMENVIITPHVAAHGEHNIEDRRLDILTENAQRFARNEELVNVVDKKAWF